MVTILNTSILTTFGNYKYEEISAKEAIESLIEDCTACFGRMPCQYCGGSGVIESFQSAVGHQATADILTKILMRNVPLNRIDYKQKIGEQALVFKLNGRIEEGKILDLKEIVKIGFSFGLLTKLG